MRSSKTMLFRFKLFFLYLKYLLSAKTKHGIHSPFVYSLLTEAISKNDEHSSFNVIENRREKLLNDKRIIEVNDLGAGSYSTSLNKRTISEIVRLSVKNKKYARLMYRLVEYFKPSTILEFGTSLGITTSYMAFANGDAKILSMEGSVAIADVAKKNLQELRIDNVEVVDGSFDEKINYSIEKLKKLDFVFIDGNHRKEATIKYFNQCLAASHEHTVFVFDDIRWSEGMIDAWEIIKGHKEVTVTVDLFFMGLVFIRKGQVKEHFIVRY
jgi:predicted O-methyltransferase YrrM